MSDTISIAEQSAAEHLKAWEQSKLSLVDYARQNGIPAQRLYQARHLQKSKAKTHRKTKTSRSDNKLYPAPEFLPVSLPSRLQAVSVEAPNGVKIHIQQALSMEDMAHLIRALQP